MITADEARLKTREASIKNLPRIKYLEKANTVIENAANQGYSNCILYFEERINNSDITDIIDSLSIRGYKIKIIEASPYASNGALIIDWEKED